MTSLRRQSPDLCAEPWNMHYRKLAVHHRLSTSQLPHYSLIHLFIPFGCTHSPAVSHAVTPACLKNLTQSMASLIT